MQDITWKELYAVICAVNTWGHHWARKKILLHCDNNTGGKHLEQRVHTLQGRQYLGTVPSTRCVYQSGIKAFSDKFKIQPLPAASLTLQFFCVDVSSHASYKTLKVRIPCSHPTSSPNYLVQLAKSTSFTLLQQRLFWAAFSLAFYGFMRVSEFTISAVSDIFSPPGLHWSNVKATNTSTCPVRAMHKYASVVPAGIELALCSEVVASPLFLMFM